jgi:hypothetical protein
LMFGRIGGIQAMAGLLLPIKETKSEHDT